MSVARGHKDADLSCETDALGDEVPPAVAWTLVLWTAGRHEGSLLVVWFDTKVSSQQRCLQ
jgi:hypothetical protein